MRKSAPASALSRSRRSFADIAAPRSKRGEILVSVRIPKPLPDEARFYKIAKRSFDDISTVAAGFSIWRGRDGSIARTRLAFGGVGPTPLRALEAEDAFTEGNFKPALRLNPIGDHRGSAAYRAAIAQSLIEKFRTEVM